MRRRFRSSVAGMTAACLFGASVGCATSSHTSVRTYEYSDEPQRERVADDELGCEYQMQSPGEMVLPGEMVSPGEIADDD